MPFFRYYLFCVLGSIGVVITAPPVFQPSRAQAITSSPLVLDANPVWKGFDRLTANVSYANASSLGALDPAISFIRCGSQTSQPEHYQPILMDDYYNALEQILAADSAMEPRTTLLLPGERHSIVSDTCAIILETRSGPFTPPLYPGVFIAHVAAMVVKRCVTEETAFLGGVALLWNRRAALYVVNPDAQRRRNNLQFS